MSKLVDSRYFTGSAVEFVDGLDVFMPEKEEPEKRGQACGRVAEGPEGRRGPAGDASGRESRGVQQAERSAGQV